MLPLRTRRAIGSNNWPVSWRLAVVVKSLIGVLVFFSLFIWSSNVSAQMCNIFGPPYATGTSVGTMVRKNVGVTFLTGGEQPTNCTPMILQMTNGANCFTFVTASGAFNCPPGMGSCRAFIAYLFLTMVGGVPTMAGAHTCSIMCDCGGGVETFTISNDDGLPVELLDFKVTALDPTRTEAPGKPVVAPGQRLARQADAARQLPPPMGQQ